MRTYRFKGGDARRRREELGLTVRAVAREVGIADGTLTNLERGAFQPSIPTYTRICKALQVDPADLREPRDHTYTPRKPKRAPEDSPEGSAA